jgi:hypothetical protein
MTSVDYADYRSFLGGGGRMAVGDRRREESEGRSRMGGSEEDSGGAGHCRRRTKAQGRRGIARPLSHDRSRDKMSFTKW